MKRRHMKKRMTRSTCWRNWRTACMESAYAPGNATEPDVKDLTEIQDLIARAARLAKQVSDRMNSR